MIGCTSVKNLGKKECNNEAVWECKGWAAQFGVPLTTYLCNDCKKLIEEFSPDSNLAIMEYNRFKPKFKKIIPTRADLIEIDGDKNG